MVKGLGEYQKMLPYFFYMLTMLFLMMVVYLTLLGGFLFKAWSSKVLVFFLLGDAMILVFKIFLLSSLKTSFVNLSVFSMKKLYIMMEGVFLYIMLILTMISFNFLEGWGNLFILPIYAFLYLVILLKLFSTPFDYFEIESELVGGGTLEIQSFGFLLWSLVEYGLIINNNMFFVFLISSTFGTGVLVNMVLVIFFTSTTLFLSGVLVSISMKSMVNLLFLGFFLTNLTLFIIIIIF